MKARTSKGTGYPIQCWLFLWDRFDFLQKILVPTLVKISAAVAHLNYLPDCISQGMVSAALTYAIANESQPCDANMALLVLLSSLPVNYICTKRI